MADGIPFLPPRGATERQRDYSINRLIEKANGTATGSLLAANNLSDLADSVSAAWWVQPLGVPIPIYTSLWGTLFDALPPIDQGYRYILLTAGEDGVGEYNEGVVDNESVSGSAPLVLATCQVNLASSPLDNATIRLINTERRFLRAGSVGTVENDAFQYHWHTVYDDANLGSNTGTAQLGGSAALRYVLGGANSMKAKALLTDSDNSGGTPRAGTETRAKNVGMNYVMRIL
jgi:hypothetical protein